MASIHIASDHAGFEVKNKVVQLLNQLGHQVLDHGPQNDQRCDYPDFANIVCQGLIAAPDSFGVLICGSGQGMAMRANKYNLIRAALCSSPEMARLSREHNNANVLCLGARTTDLPILLKTVEQFFVSSFEGGRHQARVDKIHSSTC